MKPTHMVPMFLFEDSDGNTWGIYDGKKHPLYDRCSSDPHNDIIEYSSCINPTEKYNDILHDLYKIHCQLSYEKDGVKHALGDILKKYGHTPLTPEQQVRDFLKHKFGIQITDDDLNEIHSTLTRT